MAWGPKEDVVVELRIARGELTIDISMKEDVFYGDLRFAFRPILPDLVSAEMRGTRMAWNHTYVSAPIRFDDGDAKVFQRMYNLQRALVSIIERFKYTIVYQEAHGQHIWKMGAQRPSTLAVEMDLAMEEYRSKYLELADAMRSTHEFFRGKSPTRG